MANKPEEHKYIASNTFMRQLRAELEMELRTELREGNARPVRNAVREELRKRLNGDFTNTLEGEIDKIKNDVKQAVHDTEVQVREKRRIRKDQRTYERLGLSLRLQHGIMALSVIWLIITGLPLKFPDVGLFVAVMDFLGGIDNSTYIHRIAATGLIIVSLWHLWYVIFRKKGRRDFLLMLPRLQDIKDFWQQMKYYFGFSKEHARFGRFSYIEKFDYWAVYWGCVIMIGTGALLWSPDITFSFAPKYIYDVAKEIHSDEALLATLAIVIWHFYNVHYNPSRFPGSMVWWHGRMTEEEMEEEHPLELEEIKKAEAERRARRQAEEQT